jgi:translation initiation factor 2 beta subunit (eIF-2beta)/eIF-5
VINTAAAAAIAAKYQRPSNPETEELERSDPRHAAARRLARITISEIKLYREKDVQAGREARDLWKRLKNDITLAFKMFERRVDADVRERFDYIYDEILRELADGDASKLGADAPAPGGRKRA